MTSFPRRLWLTFVAAVLLGVACGPAAPSSSPVAATAGVAPPTAAPQPAVTSPTASAATTPPAPTSRVAATASPAAGSPAPNAPVSGDVVVFAASSLTDVFQDMVADFQQANPNARLTFNFGSSSQLATQLGQGAKADVFASADTIQMDNAKKADAIAGPDHVFARNQLVLITPQDNPRKIAGVKDLAGNGVKFVTAQPSVPIGQYTDQMLDKANADAATYGPDFRARVQANIVSREDNVRQVVSKVQLGEADAAVVYSTDATPQVRPQLEVLPIPDALQTLATYPIAAAKGSNAAGGQAFVAYVLGAKGQATLSTWGFLPPPPPPAPAPETSPSAQPSPAASATVAPPA